MPEERAAALAERECGDFVNILDKLEIRMLRVRVFVDHSNFDIGWRGRWKRNPPRVAWSKLPELVERQLQTLPSVHDKQIDLRGITVYASVRPDPDEHEARQAHWLQYGLDQLPGYTVKIRTRQKRTEKCSHGHLSTHYVEKGVDTQIACDMLSLAMRNLYDLAVIISDDADLIPSVECVQDVLDRQIVHLGFRSGGGEQLRSAAWSHVLFDDFVSELCEQPKQAPANIA